MTRHEMFAREARRLGMTVDEMMRHMGGRLFYVQHPDTKEWVWCWQLNDEQGKACTEEFYNRHRRFTDFMLSGPKTAIEGFLWVFMIPFIPLIAIFEGSKKVLGAVDKAVTKAAYEDLCCGGGGDGLFDHVNSMRKADIDFLFGGKK